MPVIKVLIEHVFDLKQCVKNSFMKNLLLLFSLAFSNILMCQEYNTLKREFEKYAPYYLLENYCSKSGLNNIINSAIVDDRVYGISQEKGHILSDSIVIIRYYNTIMVFDKYEGIPYLSNFSVYFTSQVEMENFIDTFLQIMDPTNEFFGWGLTNNLVSNNGDCKLIEGFPYKVICFVNQWDYCK